MEEELKEEVKEENVTDMQTTKKAKRSDRIFYIVIGVLIVLVLGVRVWFSNAFGKVIVSGDSMNRTLQDGETLFMNLVKDGKGLERGDIIVVDVSKYQTVTSQGESVQFIIKRLIAVEGDKVKCRDGQVSICYAGTVDYVPLEETYAYYGGRIGEDKSDYDFAEYTVGEGEIFFLGDNRLNSVDSRYKEGYSHLRNSLYKATDVYGVVSDWAYENRGFLSNLFFL